MAGLWSRLKIFLQDEKLLYSDLNAEFNNVQSNSELIQMKGHSDDPAQLQATEDPAPGGTPSVGTGISGADEIERLRFVVNRMIGGSQWYSPPTLSLDVLSSLVSSDSPTNLVSSGRINGNNQPIWLVPGGTTAKCSILGSATHFNYRVSNVPLVLTTDILSTNLQLAQASNNTGLIPTSFGINSNQTTISLGSCGSNIIVRDGKITAFKIVSGGNTEYLIGRVRFIGGSDCIIDSAQRGMFFNSIDSNLPSFSHVAGTTVTLMSLNWIFIKNDNTVDYTTSTPVLGGTAPVAPSVGDYWYDQINLIWKKFSVTGWIDSGSTLVGMVICDTTNAIAARSFYPHKNYKSDLYIDFRPISATEIVSTNDGYYLSSYGNTINSESGLLTFVLLDTGTIQASSTYYLYVKDTGNCIMSLIRPIDLRYSIGGWYYPSAPWRCVGRHSTDGGSAFNTSMPLSINTSYEESVGVGLSSTTNTSYVDASGLTVSIEGTGDPIEIQLVAADFVLASEMKLTCTTGGAVEGWAKLVKVIYPTGEVDLGGVVAELDTGGLIAVTYGVPLYLSVIDRYATRGTNVYKIKFRAGNTHTTIDLIQTKLVASEIGR